VDDYSGGNFVLGFEVEELDALDASADVRMDLVSMRMILPNWLMTRSSLVSSTRLMPVTFPILRAVFKTEFPKWESLKNKSGKVACFSSPNPDRQLTSFHQQSTTTSPRKHHVLPPVFAKIPSKNEVPPPPKNYRKHPLLKQGFGSRGDDHSGSHSVLIRDTEDLGATNSRKFSDDGECSKNVPKSKATKFLRRKPLRLRF
jgi:hypothetical protein